MDNPGTADGDVQSLLACLKEFCFPGGEDAARLVRGVKTSQRGELRMSPGGRWNPFTAEERIDATQSGFCWDARFRGGVMGSFVVTDAYEGGHGRLVVKLGGVFPVKKVVGRDADQGELQRYLSSIVMCPPILLNHPSLEWTCPAFRTLRVRDRNDPTGATVDLVIGKQGLPMACQAERPRMVGKQTLLTAWSGICLEFKEWDGLGIAHQFEVAWHLPDGPFTYYRGEITSFNVVR
jgi:hypothetical protein